MGTRIRIDGIVRSAGWRRAFVGMLCSLGILLSGTQVNAGSEVTRIQFLSESLGMKRDVHVYLPAQYSTDKDARFPVVVALHGLGGEGGDFFSHGKMKTHLDRLIGKRTIRPVIVVAPHGDNGYWTNHPSSKGKAALRWADYVSKDLIAEIDTRFRTDARREGRALVGVSMGGFGALSIGLANRDKFHAMISLSGAIFATPPGCRGGELRCTGGKAGKGTCTLSSPTCSGKIGRMAKRSHYRNAWGYPPNLQQWNTIGPMGLLAKLAPDSTELPRLYLHCGASDKRFHAFYKQAHRLLKANGVEHEHRSVKGAGHSWKAWEAETRRWLIWLEEGWAASTSATPSSVSPTGK